MNWRTLLLILFFIGKGVQAAPSSKSFMATVIGIKDGDTIEVLKGKEIIVVRLADIDCPEKSQPFGKAAKKFCADICFRKEVRVVSNGKTDRNKRLIATVYVAGKSLNETLVRQGYAWHFKKYSDSKPIADMELEARRKQVGLWADSRPIPPWEWRKSKTARTIH